MEAHGRWFQNPRHPHIQAGILRSEKEEIERVAKVPYLAHCFSAKCR